MALGANSYGDTGEIASYCPNWVNSSGIFDTSTLPKLAQVESWADQVSAALNSVLSEYGFSVPVTDADVKLMLDMFVNEEVASIVEGIHGFGRFGPDARGRSSTAPGRHGMILQDVREFIEGNQVGMERQGATRSYSATSGVGFRETDESGDTPAPLFEREAFGETYKEWDED